MPCVPVIRAVVGRETSIFAMLAEQEDVEQNLEKVEQDPQATQRLGRGKSPLNTERESIAPANVLALERPIDFVILNEVKNPRC